MDDLCRYADRPYAFLGRYIRQRPFTHGAILVGVLGAVACSISTQYGVKTLVDALGANSSHKVWVALALLAILIGCDNLLWRVASFIASLTFVKVTGDIRRDLFRHLTGHAPAYFSDRQPGTLASRVTATSNAFFQMENMAVWNVLPPCVACFGAIIFFATVSMTMAVTLGLVCAIFIIVMFRIAAAGKALHHDFADKAAAVDGEVVDLVGNMTTVKSFGNLPLEFLRFDHTLSREMRARSKSLLYLERLRLLHAVVTIFVTVGLLFWAMELWQSKAISSGQVILVATLSIQILAATRDLAVALVDATQHLARLSEALKTLLVPHTLTDHPEATELVPRRAKVEFNNIVFSYGDGGRKVFDGFNLSIEPGEWIGLVGESGGGKSTLFQLLQRFYDIEGGTIRVDGQDISLVTQESLREAITVVPQDISLFHRSLMENIRYGRPDASDDEVWRAAEAANCRAFIDQLPEGLETMVGDRGTKLSGGQRQRVAIARAVLKNTPILLLDEATSALDSKSEAEVRAALENLMRGRTVIAIAHRLTTLNGFHRIVKLENGRIVSDLPPEKAFAESFMASSDVQAGAPDSNNESGTGVAETVLSQSNVHVLQPASRMRATGRF